MIDGYLEAFNDRSAVDDMPVTISTVMKKSTRRTWKHLSQERIGDITPEFPIGKRFWPLLKSEKRSIEALFWEPDMGQTGDFAVGPR